MESQAPLSTSTPTNQFSLQSGLASQKRKRDIEYYTSSPAHKARRGTQSAPQHTQNEFQPPPQLQPRPHLHINYLARQSPQDVRLLSTAESLPATLALLNAYHAILDRSESLAANLGARPWSQVLLASFYRMFDGPPHVVESPSYIESSVTWLDVVEFAATYPDRFILPPEDVSTGARVCDCWIKGCKVRVSEHDWLLVKSGALQRVIPPQPVREDEERELGTCEILEEIVGSVVGLADQGKLLCSPSRVLPHSVSRSTQAFPWHFPANIIMLHGHTMLLFLLALLDQRLYSVATRKVFKVSGQSHHAGQVSSPYLPLQNLSSYSVTRLSAVILNGPSWAPLNQPSACTCEASPSSSKRVKY